jgi:tRNA U34 5-methylaminomethyl-2-thiouridine-forming methyltransferase MnmC
MPESAFELVQLKNGTWSVRSKSLGETFHPVIGPVEEARALYVHQLKLPARMEAQPGGFVVWDIGLGSAANVCALLEATRHLTTPLRIISFDCTPAPLQFALTRTNELSFLAPYQSAAATLLKEGSTQFKNGSQPVTWEYHEADFPTLIASPEAGSWPKPDAILFDAFSPARNPDMWTLPLFSRLASLLDPERPCSLATYSRSTLLRVTLLLAGFHVGAGHATGEKEETTVASNSLSLVGVPLGADWLSRVRRSTSAEPLLNGTYQQQPLSPENWDRLERHPQFRKEHDKASA